MNKWGIIYCPDGSRLRPQKRWEKIAKALDECRVDYDHVQSENIASVGRLVRMMIDNGYRTVIVVGGDAALNEAVNSIMSRHKDEREQIRLGVIPNGRINDFAHFWGFRYNDIQQTVRWLKRGRVRRIDLGCIRYANKRHEQCHRYFLNCLNIGLVASVMDLRRKTQGSIGATILSFIPSSLILCFQRLEYKMRIRINDDEIRQKVMAVCIGNAPGYGFTPNAVPYNGMLDVSVVSHPQVTQLFEGFYLLYSGKILNHRDVHPYRTKEVFIDQAHKAGVGIDGRLMNTPVGPFRVNVETEVLNFIIPQ